MSIKIIIEKIDEIKEMAFTFQSNRTFSDFLFQIVDNILSYLDLPSLKLSRLINSQYNEIASTLLFQKEVIAFSKPSHLSSYLSTVAKVKDNTNEDDPSHSPRHHTRFHFNFDPDTLDPELSNFFTQLGPRVNSLHYTTDIILAAMPKELPHLGNIWALTPTLTHLQLEIKWGCPSVLFKEPLTLPSLRKLTLDLVLTEREVEAASSFLEQLLSSAPNLEEIEIPGSKKFFDDYTNVLLARLILRLPLKRLSRLNFCLALNPLQVLELGQKGLPLRTLILDFADVHHFSFPVSFRQTFSISKFSMRFKLFLSKFQIAITLEFDRVKAREI